LLKAIQQSCNVFFYKNGLEVGLRQWSHFSRLFGFGARTGIDLPNESPGLVPDEAYFNSKYGDRGWTLGLLVNLSVGQGDLLTMPLQMAYFAMMIGNEGIGYRPRLVQKIQDPNTGAIETTATQEARVEGVSPATYEIIKQGMYSVVNEVGGTGRAAWVAGAEACGKTGTAQNPHGKSHAWFIGFAPRDNPEIAFCVFVENGGGGGAVAAPIARVVIQTYLGARHALTN